MQICIAPSPRYNRRPDNELWLFGQNEREFREIERFWATF